MKTTTFYLVLRIADWEPFIICKDGNGTSTLDEAGYQNYYASTPIEHFLKSRHISIIGKWEE